MLFMNEYEKCPECGNEVIDDEGDGKHLSCSSCDWAGSYSDASEREYRQALKPIKAFRTRHGADFDIYEARHDA